MNSLLQSVAQRGTGAKHQRAEAHRSRRQDRNDQRLARRMVRRLSASLVAIAWIGYDTPRSLGDKETGGGLALPVWIDYMSRALKGVPEYKMPMPHGVVIAWR